MTDQSYTTQLAEMLPTSGAAQLTMPTHEIAELCDTRHNQVVETVERLFEKGVLRESRKTTRKVQSAKGGRPMNVYDLTKRDTLVIVAGYNDEVRAKIIDRWMELEARPVVQMDPMQMLGDPAAMRVLLLGYTEKVIALEGTVAQQGDRLKKLDRIEGAYGSMCLTDAAKTLKKRPQECIKFMNSRGWIYKRVGNASWVGRQEKIQLGYLEHREHVYRDSDGVERVATRVLVTGKGLVRLAALLDEPMH